MNLDKVFKNSLDPLVHRILQFLQQRYDDKRPLLLALSGGNDSRALFEILLCIQQQIPLSFHVAHVDHCWRVESTQQAEQLAQMAQNLQIPFHLQTLSPALFEQGNREEQARIARLGFFKALAQVFYFQAVLIAHHADDQAETILKRLFEGSSPDKWQGIEEESFFEGLPIWRPLLKIRKVHLEKWLEQRAIHPLQDSSNNDPHYLRTRLRHVVLPQLAACFGKEITQPLHYIAQTAQELQAYLQIELEEEIAAIEKGAWGFYLPLSAKRKQKSQKFILKELLRQLARRTVGETPSHSVLEALCQQINKMNSRCNWNHCQFIIADRGIFLLTVPPLPPLLLQPLPLRPGLNCLWGPWQIDCSMATEFTSPLQKGTGWQAAWQGSIQCIVPIKSGYSLVAPKGSFLYPRKKPLRHWWNRERIPFFLRETIPLVFYEGDIKGQLFCHQIFDSPDRSSYRVTLNYIHQSML